MTRLLGNWLAAASLLRIAACLAALAALGAQANDHEEIECPGYWVNGVCFETPPGTDLTWPPANPPNRPPTPPPDDPCPPVEEPPFPLGIACADVFPGLPGCIPFVPPPDLICALTATRAR